MVQQLIGKIGGLTVFRLRQVCEAVYMSCAIYFRILAYFSPRDLVVYIELFAVVDLDL